MVGTDERTGEAQLIDVVGLAGQHVRATIWTGTSGWRYRAVDGAALVGGEWHETRCLEADDCRRVRYRIVAAERDTSTNTMVQGRSNDDVWLYRVHYADTGGAPGQARTDSTTATWKPVCAGDGAGLFVAGRWRPDGSYDPDGFTFSCTTGAIAKCVRDFGYRPWDRRVSPARQMVAMRARVRCPFG